MNHSDVKHLSKVDHTPATLDDAAKLLLKGAALIEERGHCKGDFQNSAGALCARGALGHGYDSGAGFGASFEAWKRLEDSLPGKNVAKWNDAPERTKEEVVSKMRAVALGLCG